MVRFYLRSFTYCTINIREGGGLDCDDDWWQGSCDDVINSLKFFFLLAKCPGITWLHYALPWHSVISWGLYISNTFANDKGRMKLSKFWWRNMWTMFRLNKLWYYSLGIEYVYFLVIWQHNMNYYNSWNVATVEQIDWGGTEWNQVSGVILVTDRSWAPLWRRLWSAAHDLAATDA